MQSVNNMAKRVIKKDSLSQEVHSAISLHDKCYAVKLEYNTLLRVNRIIKWASAR